MATAYPGGVDNFTNPTASDTLNSATVPHAEQHANANDAIEAIEGELGTNPSGAYSTVKDRLDAIGTTVTAPITNAGSTVAPVIGINASSSDTANYVVQRDANQSFSIGAINFDTLSSQVSAAAKLYWDGQQTLNLGLGGGNVSIALGQEVISYVTNAEATTLAVGEVVYLYGAQGDRPTVKRASNASDTTSSKTFGIVAESIAAGGSGFVMNRGVAQKVNTAAFNPGDILWLGSTPGTFTTTKPVAPEHLVFVGVVLRSNSGNGLVFVSPQNGYELDEIHDVLLTNETDGDLLKYDGASGLWKNAAQSTLGVSYTQVSGLGTAATRDAAVAGGVATLDGAGLVPTNQLPALAITNTFVVSSQAAMLALTAQPGDVAVRTDLSKSYILTADPASTLANWQELLTPPDAVSSVDGRTGAVTLTDKYASLAAANAFTVGGHTITNAAAGVVPLTVTGAASQSADLLNVAASGGTSVFKINSTGTLLMGAGLGVAADYVISRSLTTGAYLQTSSTHMYAIARDATNIALVVKGASGQSVDVMSLQDSSGALLMRFTNNGTLFANNLGVFGNTSGALGRITAYAGSAGTIGAVIRGAASQSASLTEWQDSSANVLAKIDNVGTIGGFRGAYFSSQFGATGQNSVVTANPSTATVVGVIVKGAASQTANLQEWQNSAGTVMTAVRNDGLVLLGSGGSYVNGTVAAPVFYGVANAAAQSVAVFVGAAGGTADILSIRATAGNALSGFDSAGRLYVRTIGNVYNAALNVATNNATALGAVIRGFTAQTADLLQLQDTAGTILGGRNANAQIFSGSTAPLYVGTGGATTAATGDGTTATITTTSAHGLAVGDMVTVAGVTPTGYNGTYRVTAVATNTVSYLNATTGAQTVAGTVSAAAQASVVARSAGTVGMVVRGAASQAAKYFDIQTSAGVSAVYVAPTLFESTVNLKITSAALGVGTMAVYTGNAMISTNAINATSVGILVRAAASQTANLQEWQDSAGNVIAKVESGGTIRSESGSVALTGNWAAMQQSNSGGVLLMKKGTAAANNPGADFARVYFRDGTNAGTLKLVVRAGAAGAETTILDNIPQ